MAIQSDISVRNEAVAQSVRHHDFRIALPAIVIALWGLILGVAAYFLTGVGG